MPEDDLTDSESEEDSQSSSADEPQNPPRTSNQQLTEYEKRRLSRIRENKARLEALGLPAMATSLMGAGQTEGKIRGKGKGKMVEDEEYRPREDEDGLSTSSGGYDDDGDEGFVGGKPSRSRARMMAKNKCSKPKKKVSIQKLLDNSVFVDDGDDALTQAIALSLKDSMEVKNSSVPSPSAPIVGGFDERKASRNTQEDAGRKKRKKLISSRVQMTEDELIVHFFQFDEAGKGNITLRDLRRVATAHDFTWTEKEIADMIRCFDSDGDDKLNLDDFRKIARRCNMTQGSETL